MWIAVVIALSTQNAHSADDILRRWSHRTEIPKAFRIEWSERTSFPKISDASHEVRRAVSVQGRRIKAERSGARGTATGDVTHEESILIWDGEARSDFFEGSGHPKAVLTDGDKRISANNHLRAVLLYVVGTDIHTGGIDLTEYRIISDAAIVDGTVCIHLQANRNRSLGWQGEKTELWVAPELNYLAKKLVVFSKGKKRFEVTIDYTEGQDGVLYPNSWRGAYLDTHTGDLQKIFDAKVTEFVVTDQFEASEFAIEFPVGTEVFDYRGSPNGDLKASYIVLEEGEQRHITPEERSRNPTYEDILATESGKAGLTAPVRTNSLLFWSLIGFFFFACLTIVSKLRKG